MADNIIKKGKPMNTILSSNETRFRLIRTIIQGVIGVLIANVDFLFSSFNFEPETKAFIVALTMAILSPIMAELGNSSGPENVDEIDYIEEVENDGN